MNKPFKIIKIGGNELSAPGVLQALVSSIKMEQKQYACVLVHGGGREIDELMKQMDLKPRYKNGQRITDETTLEIAEMVLSGKINKNVELKMGLEGIEASGLSGVDRKLLQVEPWGSGMDLVGQIVNVRTEVFEEFGSQNIVCVVSPISAGLAGRYNVNADHAAGKIAGALKAEEAIFITNVPGVLIENHVIPQISENNVHEQIQNGTIHGGMIPKVNAAIDAIEFGAKSARITNMAGFVQGTGTTIIADRRNYD